MEKKDAWFKKMIQHERARKSEFMEQEFKEGYSSREEKVQWIKDFCLKNINAKSEFLATVIAGIDAVSIVPHVFCSGGAHLVTLHSPSSVSLVNELQISEGLFSTIRELFFKGSESDGLSYLKASIKEAVRFNFVRCFNESIGSEEDPARQHAIILLRNMTDQEMFSRLDSMIEDGCFYAEEAEDINEKQYQLAESAVAATPKIVSLTSYRETKLMVGNNSIYAANETFKTLESFAAKN